MKWAFWIFAIISSVLTLQAQPTNDSFANRAALSWSGPFLEVAGTTVGATSDASEPFLFSAFPTESVWYSWTATRDSLFFVSAIGTCPGRSCTPFMAVFTGGTLTNLTLVATNSTGTRYDDMEASIQIEAKAGVQYQIRMANAPSPQFTVRVYTENFWVQSPASGADLELGQDVLLRASPLPAELVGQVSRVEFFTKNLEVLGHSDGPDYQYTWRNLGPGQYSAGMRATNTAGETLYFPGVIFTVSAKNGEASLSLPYGPAIGSTQVGISGTYGLRFALDITEDFTTWTQRASGWITSNPMTIEDGGIFGTEAQFPDFELPQRRFYRLRINP